MNNSTRNKSIINTDNIIEAKNTSVFDKLSKDEIINYLAVNVTMEYYYNDKPNDFYRLQSRIKDVAYFIKNGNFLD